MRASLDLPELVEAAVADDTTSRGLNVTVNGGLTEDDDAGSKSSSTCSDAAAEVIRRMNDVRTFLEPLLLREVEIWSIPLHLANQDNCACWEMMVVNEDVYPEDSMEKKEILDFLENFDISDKTEQIVRVLEEYGETVKIHSHEYVPVKVSYVEFWTRFFYRCDEQRVQRELDQAERKKSDKDVVGGLSKNHAVWIQESSAPASPSSVLRGHNTVKWDPRLVEKLEESWK